MNAFPLAMILRFLPILLRRLLGWSVLLMSGALAGSVPARADDVIPQAPPASNYAKMASHSPFSPPTAPLAAPAATPPPPVPGWADSLTAKMIVQDGVQYMVMVVDAQNPDRHLYLTAEPEGETQIAVASVKWGATRDDPPAITLRKGKEFAQVRYDAGAASAAGGNSAGGGPPIPGAVRNPPGAQPFHAPLQANVVPNAGQGPSNNLLRRPLIRSQPAAAPALGRPGVNPPANGIRPNPALPADDDDDD